MSSKKTTTQTSTMTPNNPQWVTDSSQAFASRIGDLLNQDPRSFVAGAQPLQQQQFGIAQALGSNAQGLVGQSADLARSAADTSPVSHATASTAYGGIGNYLNPFSQYVAGNTLNELGRARDMAQAGNGRDAILAGQYGGSRQGVVDANLNRDFFGQVGNTLGNLYFGGFNTALGASNDDANRAQQTSIFNAGADNTAALAAQQAKLAAAGQLGQLGMGSYDALSGAAQQQYGLAQAQATAPLSTVQQLSSAYGGLPLNLFNGQTTNGKTTETTGFNPLNYLSGSMKLFGGPFSLVL
jgi:hypothetical protein